MNTLNRIHAIEYCRDLSRLFSDIATALDHHADLTALELFLRAGRKVNEMTTWALWTPAMKKRAGQLEKRKQEEAAFAAGLKRIRRDDEERSGTFYRLRRLLAGGER